MSELQTITFDEYTDRLMPFLHEILVLRLSVSKSWMNVSVETGVERVPIEIEVADPEDIGEEEAYINVPYIDVRWMDPKDGKPVTQTKRIQPFNARTLSVEIATQFEKLQEDMKQAQQ